MLEIGNGNLTLAESRTHFAFWAAMKSPLIIGTELDILPADHVAILANKGLVSFNQDEVFGGPATPFKWGVNPDWTFNATNPAEFWSGPSTKGTLLLMLNTLDVPSTRSINFTEIPQLQTAIHKTTEQTTSENAGGKKGVPAFKVENVWTGENLGCVKEKVEVVGLEGHDTGVCEFCVFLKLPLCLGFYCPLFCVAKRGCLGVSNELDWNSG